MNSQAEVSKNYVVLRYEFPRRIYQELCSFKVRIPTQNVARLSPRQQWTRTYCAASIILLCVSRHNQIPVDLLTLLSRTQSAEKVFHSLIQLQFSRGMHTFWHPIYSACWPAPGYILVFFCARSPDECVKVHSRHTWLCERQSFVDRVMNIRFTHYNMRVTLH